MSVIRRLPISARIAVCGLGLGIVVVATAFVLRLWIAQVEARQPNAIEQILANTPLPMTPVTGQSSPEEVRALMLHSHELWQTVQGQATMGWLTSEEGMAEFTETIQIQQFGKVRLEHGPLNGDPTFFWVSDGDSIWQEDLTQKTYSHGAVPPYLRSLEAYSPPRLPTDFGPVVILHPLTGTMPTLLAEDLFPFGTAQTLDDDKHLAVLGESVVAGRNAVILRAESTFEGALDSTILYWVDATTGMVLKKEIYQGSPDSGQLAQHTYFNAVVFDEPITGNPFTFSPDSDLIQATPED